jgi:hypothetical protein
MRCPRCGCNNREEQQTCWRCGSELLSDSALEVTVTELPTVAPATPSTVSHDTRERLEPRPAPSVARRSLWQTLFPCREEIAGTIIAVEPVREERRQRSWHRFAFLGLLAIAALALPFILLSFSALLIIVVVVLCILLFKFISPGRILQSLLFFRLLWPRQHDNRVPVQYFRMRDGQQREYIVRIGGRLRGHIMPGDEVILEGNFQHGIFEMKEGTNLRTRSLLEVRPER